MAAFDFSKVHRFTSASAEAVMLWLADTREALHGKFTNHGGYHRSL